VPDRPRYVYVPNIRYQYAKLGQKPEPKRRSVNLLPDASELPGDGWVVLDERTWRTGRIRKPAAWGVRARQQGSVTAIRSFEQKAVARWVWAEVMPLASDDDAAEALTELPNRFVRNPRSIVTLTSEFPVNDITVPGCSQTWAYAQEGTSSMGDSTTQMLAGAVGRVLFCLGASGLRDMWSWDEVILVAGTIVERIEQSAE
jgi:hypothetical protein